MDWMLIDEMDPPDGEYILLSFANFSVPAVGRFKWDNNGDGAFYLGDEMETCASMDLYVNAWMKLPKCYREE